MLFFGNLISMVGCVLMVLIGFVRKKERVITLQCFQFGFLAAGNLILGAVSGFISGVVSILRNLIFPRVKGGLWLKLVFIALQVVFTVLAGWAGPISLLPLFAGILFTWFIDTKSDIQLKWVIIIAQVMWGFYDFYYRNFVAFTFDVLTILSNLMGICALKKNGIKI
ncbi:MAG: YgjV family protein [Ruminococcaceae bacterium]|nr:YgjV family protein [Oscillospiraceae bacterium]